VKLRAFNHHSWQLDPAAQQRQHTKSRLQLLNAGEVGVLVRRHGVLATLMGPRRRITAPFS
jgi:hypothetical protein